MDMDMFELRRKNLASIVGDHRGAQVEFSKKHGIDASYLSQLLSGHRNLGEKSARSLEQDIGLRAYSLDNIKVTPTGGNGDILLQIEDALDGADWLSREQKGNILALVKSLKPNQE